MQMRAMASVYRPGIPSVRTTVSKLRYSRSVASQRLQKMDNEVTKIFQNVESFIHCCEFIPVRISPKSLWRAKYSGISSHHTICYCHFSALKFCSTASSAEFQSPEETYELPGAESESEEDGHELEIQDAPGEAETVPKLKENIDSRYEIKQRLKEESNKIREIIEKDSKDMEHSLNHLAFHLTSELVKKVLSSIASAKSALRFFRWAQNQPGFKPNSVIYDELINIVGRSKDFDTLQVLLSTKVTEGCFNSTKTFSFATIWHDDPATLKNVTQMMNKLENFHRKSAYDMLIAALCKGNYVDAALSVLQEMLNVGCALNSFTFHPLVIAFCRNDQIEKANQLFQVMKGRDCSPDLICYNFVLASLCKKKRFSEAARLLRTMINSPRCKPNAVTYDTLILAACKTGKVEGALRLFRRMKEDGLKPLYCTYTNLISGLLEAGEFDKAYALVNQDSGKDLALDFSSYTFLIRSCSKLGKIQEARDVLMEMKAKNLNPDDQLCNEVFGENMLSQAA